MTDPTAGALHGLKVLDLTLMLAGPYCTMILADQGADVIKVEPPNGDMTRGLGPYFPDDERKEFGGYFQSVNRNKRSIVINLKTEQGREMFFHLVRQVDVLVENFRSGVMERLGLGYETLRQINPRLVYGALRGFGDRRCGESPYIDWPAYDVVAQAMGGPMGITGPGKDHPPLKLGPGVGDLIPAMLLSSGILAALRHVDATGEGQFVDVSMYDAMISLCERIVYQYSYTGAIPGPEGGGHPMLCPFGIFPAKDGWVSIACPQQNFWVMLCSLMDRPELAEDPRYSSNSLRLSRRDEVVALLGEWTSLRTKAELAKLLGGKVPFGPVNDARDIHDDLHVARRHMIVQVEQPGSQTRASIANTPIKMTRTPGGVRQRAPLLDEHAEAIMREFGLTSLQHPPMPRQGAL